MERTVTKALSYFTKSLYSFKKQHNADFDAEMWYNLQGYLTAEDIEKIKKYAIKKQANTLFIVSGNKDYLRPQRTWGCYPREFYNFSYEDCGKTNSFIYLSWRGVADHDETDEEFKARVKKTKKQLKEDKKNKDKLISQFTDKQLANMFDLNRKRTPRSEDLEARQKLIEAISEYGNEPEIKTFVVIDTILKVGIEKKIK